MYDKSINEGMLPVGTLLFNGKYEVKSYLSSGGFGNTYVALDTVFDELVAIKELYIKGVCGRDSDSNHISISLTENQRTFEAQQDKFRKEAKRLRKLDSPHIIKVRDLFDENGTCYYAMDLVDGASLSQIMKRTGKAMTEHELMLILPQILDALETVHSEGIWHLDLKPANIMLDRNGNALLIDFGASKQLRNKDGNSLSTSSALAYTPGYAPSEQMEQSMDRFGPWTDLYSLGATMYNLLTKNQPPSPSEIAEDAEAALSLPSAISSKTKNLIMWLMNPNRKMRPQSVSDVKQFLVELPKKRPAKEPMAQKKDEQHDDTILKSGKKQTPASNNENKVSSLKKEKKGLKKLMPYIFAVLGVVGVVVGAVIVNQSGSSTPKLNVTVPDSEVNLSDVSGSNKTFTANGVSFTMVYVEGGTFTMGATSEQGSDASSDEKPTHSVTLSNYYIGETEVTQGLWEAVMGSNPSYFKGNSRLPVESVSWEDCQRFISKLNSMTGQQFHLPTEAQWEYAARGGSRSRGYKYSGSNDLGSVAWYDDNSGSKTHVVKTKSANELGLYDMSGNVTEWCSDWYGSYSSGSQTNPTGASSGSGRVGRGGGWGNITGGCRSAYRYYCTPSDCDDSLGLRLAL